MNFKINKYKFFFNKNIIIVIHATNKKTNTYDLFNEHIQLRYLYLLTES